MKKAVKIFVILLMTFSLTNTFAQAPAAKVRQPKTSSGIAVSDSGVQKHAKASGIGTGNPTPSQTVGCGPGLYPNGTHCYPCLGCHPCGNTYCDNDNALAVQVSQLDAGKLIQDFSAGKLKTLISEKDLRRLVKENSAQSAQKEKVKCSCGKDVYGKDAAACERICEFLGSTSSNY